MDLKNNRNKCENQTKTLFLSSRNSKWNGRNYIFYQMLLNNLIEKKIRRVKVFYHKKTPHHGKFYRITLNRIIAVNTHRIKACGKNPVGVT